MHTPRTPSASPLRRITPALLVLPLLLGRCAGDDAEPVSPSPDGGFDAGAPADAGPEVGPDVDPDPVPEVPAPARCTGGAVLFGAPSNLTGLGAEACNGSACVCGGEPWTVPVYDDDDLAALRAWRLATPWAEVTEDPYALPTPPTEAPDAVCAMVVEDRAARTYRLETFATLEAAEAAGARVTHTGACGVCSTLDNLAVYIAQPDLTDPVRQCGLLGITEGMEANVECLLELGFGLPCAQIWYWNTQHTRSRCLQSCLGALNQPYHLPDGSLNECLRCDEVQSGDVFKAVAGRTRRNSGLANTMCRPCDEVTRLVHAY